MKEQETNFDNSQLDDMRRQMSVLQKKLEQQEIVNDKLVRRSMKAKMSWIKKYLVIVIFAIPFVAFAMLPMVYSTGVSWWCYGFTIVMMIAEVCADWYVNYVPSDFFQKDNLVETARKLTDMKQLRKWCTIINMVVFVLWLLWLVAELWLSYSNAADNSHAKVMAVSTLSGVVIGTLIGVPIGLHIYFRMQRTTDEIIDQIEDLMSEK